MKNYSIFLATIALVALIATSCSKDDPIYIPGDGEATTAAVNEGKAPNPTNRDYVDFGLPSGTKWAKVNVTMAEPTTGSKAPWGDYFNWGTTARQWDLKNRGEYNNWTTDRLDATYDAATANWGKEWQMPTSMDFYELANHTVWTWQDANQSPQGIAGYLITGKGAYADRSIFLPAAGYSVSGQLKGRNTVGYYWSASPYKNSLEQATATYINSTTINTDDVESRYYGCCIRPVRKK